MGQFYEYVKMAISSVRQNKGRSLLTMLGIIIGITSVITIVSIGNGVKTDMLTTLETGDQVGISINTSTEDELQFITPTDIELLEQSLEASIEGIVVTNQGQGTTDTRKGTFDLSLSYTTSEANEISYMPDMYAGAYFTEQNESNGDYVCVIDKISAIKMFGTQDVLGLDFEIQVGNRIQSVRICGIREMSDSDVAEIKQMEELYGFEYPISVEMPYLMEGVFADTDIEFARATLILSEGIEGDAIAEQAVRILNNRYMSQGENLFMKEQTMDMSAALSTMLDMVTAFIAFVAGISLLVGGIGVMNIMLVSVTERTREIGIRKALGAKTSSIVAQFLCESAIISGLGGGIGILLGAGISAIINLTNVGGLTANLSIGAVMGATLFSCSVGLVFGIYPAKKAAQMRPIDALRQM
ncbi:MAG: ABC transporter permease [Eubacteriales bacterium]